MRAICCAILALIFYGMGAVMSNSERGRGLVGGMHILLSYVFIAITIGLCIAGL